MIRDCRKQLPLLQLHFFLGGGGRIIPIGDFGITSTRPKGKIY